VREAIGPAATAPTGSPPFTPRAKKVMEFSLREALQLGHNYIGTECRRKREARSSGHPLSGPPSLAVPGAGRLRVQGTGSPLRPLASCRATCLARSVWRTSSKAHG
jgi:hypothetical protein